jgi:hypothetical protein
MAGRHLDLPRALPKRRAREELKTTIVSSEAWQVGLVERSSPWVGACATRGTRDGW